MDNKFLLEWDNTGDRLYETGIKNTVLYPYTNKEYKPGVAWSGITSINENPSGADETSLYADDIKYLSLRSAEQFGVTIEAYTYPDEWMACDGSASLVEGVSIGQQSRQTFGLCYKSTIGNDTDGLDHGYKLHLVYGGTAAVSSRQYSSINDSPEAITFSWEVSTVPVAVTDHKPTSVITIDSTKVDAAALAKLEAVLYGQKGSMPSQDTVARLPLPDEVVEILTSVNPTPGENA